mmetsp:Transcript_62407/g.69773  ORF Transcript_62407/g.69773 Transcript_62407/m.69773 type:complete len:83 (+) Transcript_62407:479-727(+)
MYTINMAWTTALPMLAHAERMRTRLWVLLSFGVPEGRWWAYTEMAEYMAKVSAATIRKMESTMPPSLDNGSDAMIDRAGYWV